MSKRRPILLVTEKEGFPEDAKQLLEEVFRVELRDLDRQGVLAEVGGADYLWVRLRNRIDAEVLDQAPQLRAIVTPTTGLNHIDLTEAERRSVRIVSLRGETAFLRDVRATAEHTIGLMLALLRRIPSASQHVESGGWNRDLFKGSELFEKTIGIVGLGRLGRLVAGYLRAFGALVIAADPNVRTADTKGIPLVPLRDLLEKSDIVSLHVKLNEETEGFFDASCFAHMKQGAILVNTARGELLDEGELLRVLERGKLGGAALDVLCNENSTGMSTSPLIAYAAKAENVIITPHIGGNTHESLEKVERYLADRLVRLASGSAEKNTG